jgi:hypothetical protein
VNYGYLAAALQDAQVVELRHQREGSWSSGLFNELPALLGAVESLATSGNLYTSLNRPRERQVANRMMARALRDASICRVVRIPFDLDPRRPHGSPSTATELRAAEEQRDRLVQLLDTHGWPRPAVGMSGNGAHAVYRCDLPADEATEQVLEAVYRGLARALDSMDVVFDTTVRNPSRVWRLYGTVNRKGAASLDRPHRLSSVEIPSPWTPVPVERVLALGGDYRVLSASQPLMASAPLGAGDYRTLEVGAWFTSHGVYRRRLSASKHAVSCPWSHEHTTASTTDGSDTVVWEGREGRWPSFYCAHAHCAERNIRTVMALWGDADQFCRAAWPGTRPPHAQT